jgi:hypothetical protein
MHSFRKFFDLHEMPIGQFQKVGWGEDAPKRRWDKKSIGILTSDKGVEKIKRQWKNTEQTFDIYLVRTKGASKHWYTGEVDKEWLKENLELDIEVNTENITAVYVSNQDGSEPMTGWVLAHRFGHAIMRTTEYEHYRYEMHQYVSNIMKDIYNKKMSWYGGSFGNLPSLQTRGGEQQKILTALAHSLGTMRSARQQNIDHLDEFGHELVAQYIITGSIKFNPHIAPQLAQKGRFGHPDVLARANPMNDDEAEENREWIQGMAETLEYYVSDMLRSFEGRVFVV